MTARSRDTVGKSSAAESRSARTAPKLPEAERSFLGPDSITWKVNREAVLLAGGGCALLMQIAHPLVAAGVAEHSRYREDPLGRLNRTLELTLAIAFGTAREAQEALRQIERRHRGVRGVLPETVGRFPAGTPYRANDPALLFWVHATLVDTALRVYEMFVEPLSEVEKDRYYEESKIIAALFGVPEQDIPANRRAFSRYMERMLSGDEIAVGEQARDIAASLLSPERPWPLRFAGPPLRLLTIGLLPEAIRRRYGYSWSAWQEHLFRAAVLTTQLALPWLPEALRYFPAARRGWQREGTAGAPLAA